jgi:WD40 repeat protein
VTVWDAAKRARAPGRDMKCPLAGPPEFSQDGSHVAAPCDDGLTVWTTEGAVVARIGNLSAASVAFSPDGRTLAVSAARGGDLQGGRLMLVRLTDSGHSAQELWSSEERTDLVWSVAFSPRGDRIAAGTVGGDVRLWDTASGERVGKPLTGHVDAVQDLAFQPHGDLLASASWDNTVRLWDLDKHAPAGVPLVEHTKRPVTLSFSPDGTRLASAGWDGVPRVWNVTDHSLYAALREEGSVQAVRFVDAENLVGTGPNGLITTWNIDPTAALEDVCERLSPQLGEDQWRQYAPDVDYVPQC